jgi:hypothetical protein
LHVLVDERNESLPLRLDDHHRIELEWFHDHTCTGMSFCTAATRYATIAFTS